MNVFFHIFNAFRLKQYRKAFPFKIDFQVLMRKLLKTVRQSNVMLSNLKEYVCLLGYLRNFTASS